MAKPGVGIINVTGYVGVELARILCQHPEVELVSVTGRSAAGQKLGQVFPHLSGIDLTITKELGEVDLAFSAMPHGESAAEVIPLLDSGIKVVDMSADFRLKNPDEYQVWYGHAHPAPHLLTQAVFGIPEIHRQEIAGEKLVANPGCYSTGAILALLPAVTAGIIGPDIIVDSKSGVSGAGRTLKLQSHFCEVDEDICAYSVEGHRLMPEIVQEVSAACKGPAPRITFVPHLIPMNRGILSTCYANVNPDLLPGKNISEEIKQIYRDFYADEPFIRITETPPHTKHTLGSNFCHIYPVYDFRTGRLIVISCLDNLVKGAAGQGVQNMNLMMGIPETTGLLAPALYP